MARQTLEVKKGKGESNQTLGDNEVKKHKTNFKVEKTPLSLYNKKVNEVITLIVEQRQYLFSWEI